MAERNYLLNALVTPVEARTGSATDTDYGTGGESYDEDYGTYYGILTEHGSDGEAIATFTGTHTWTTPVDISRIKTKLYAQSHAFGNYASRDLTFDIYVRQSGSWVSIYHKNTHSTSTGETEETNSQNIATGWTDVTGVRIYCYGRAYSYEGTRKQEASAFGYEVQAFYTVVRSFSGIV